MAEDESKNEETPAQSTGLVEGAAAEIRDQVYSEEHPLGPFKAPESVETTGIRENVGYVPRWLVYLFIMAVILSLFAWMKMGQPG
jgi:hypothetical protein